MMTGSAPSGSVSTPSNPARIRIGFASQPSFSASPPRTPNKTRFVRERQRRGVGGGASELATRAGAGAGAGFTMRLQDIQKSALPHEGKDTISDFPLILGVARQIRCEHAFLVEQPPHEQRNEHDDGNQPPP